MHCISFCDVNTVVNPSTVSLTHTHTRLFLCDFILVLVGLGDTGEILQHVLYGEVHGDAWAGIAAVYQPLKVLILPDELVLHWVPHHLVKWNLYRNTINDLFSVPNTIIRQHIHLIFILEQSIILNLGCKQQFRGPSTRSGKMPSHVHWGSIQLCSK